MTKGEENVEVTDSTATLALDANETSATFNITAIDNAGYADENVTIEANKANATVTLYKAPEFVLTTSEGTIQSGAVVDKPVTITTTPNTPFMVNGIEVTENESNEYSYNATDDGIYTAKVSDIYGSNETVIFTINSKAPEAPVISVDPASGYAKQATVTITYPSDAKDKKYTIDSVEKTYDGPFTVTANATVTAYYTAGANSLTAELVIKNIDGDAPDIKFTTDDTNIKVVDSKTSASSVAVTVSDKVSGIDSNCNT